MGPRQASQEVQVTAGVQVVKLPSDIWYNIVSDVCGFGLIACAICFFFALSYLINLALVSSIALDRFSL
jgi:hypothetical protein